MSLPSTIRKLLLEDKNGALGSGGGVCMGEEWINFLSSPPNGLLMEGVFILVM